MQLPLKSISSNPLLSYRIYIYIYSIYQNHPTHTHTCQVIQSDQASCFLCMLFHGVFLYRTLPPRKSTWNLTQKQPRVRRKIYKLPIIVPRCLFSGGARFLCKGGSHQHQRQKTTSRPLSSFRSSVATWRWKTCFSFRVCLSGNGSFYRESTKSTMVHENNLWGWFGLLQHWFVLSKPELVLNNITMINVGTVYNSWVFPQMVVPPKHSKMITSSRKTHGCWVPPF